MNGHRRSARRGRRTAGLLAGLSLAAGLAAVATSSRPAAAAPDGAASCAPLDVAIVLDSTSSMDPAIENVKAGLAGVVSTIETVSGDDYRLGLVDFGRGIEVHQAFAPQNAAAVRDLLPGLSQRSDNSGFPEAWDEALRTVVTTRSAGAVDGQEGDFDVPWRPEAQKLVILVTDAMPAGLDDRGTDEDVANARAAAAEAAAAGIRVTTIFVPNSNSMPEAGPLLQDVAAVTGSTSLTTLADGANLDAGLQLATSECGADSDGDGLWDNWETKGYDGPDDDDEIDVDLPAMGFTPDHQDLFLQVNWMPARTRPCLSWVCPVQMTDTGVPDEAALERLVTMFAEAPTPNPDGTTGIRLHVDAGEYTPRNGDVPEAHRRGGEIIDSLDMFAPVDEDFFAEMDGFRDDAVDADRRALLTFVLYGRRIGSLDRDGRVQDDDVLGKATGIPADSFAVATDLMRSTDIEVSTLAHELGHTLGLLHGGNDHTIRKPNYLSVMNHDVALGGGFELGGRRVVDYSRWDLAPLDQSRLDETRGVPALLGQAPDATTTYRCPARDSEAHTAKVNAPIDWDCDGSASSTSVRTQIIPQSVSEPLTSRNDWATLSFGGGERGGLESDSEPVTEEDSFDYDGWRSTEKAFAVEVLGPGTVTAPADAGELRLDWLVTNLGTQPVRLVPTAAWRTEPGLGDLEPSGAIDVAVGASVPLSLAVDLDDAVRTGDTAEVRLDLASEGGEIATSDTAVVTLGSARSASASGRISFDPSSATVGDTVDGTADGFEPGASVSVRADGPGTAPAEVVADDDGRVEIPVELTGPGDVTVTAVGPADDGAGLDEESSPLAGAERVQGLASRSGTVTAERPDDDRPSRARSVPESDDTNVIVAGIALGVALLTALALVVVLAVRRRRSGG